MVVNNNLRLLAEGKISPAVDVYIVYRALFYNEQPPEPHRIYCVPDQFLSVTYITPAFRQYLEDFLSKLVRGESEIYVLPALLGSGKSHFLALLLHIIALYRRCNGVGECVSKELEKYGLRINTPTISKVPDVIVFHGQYSLDDAANTIRKVGDKNELRALLRNRAPVVLIFDETQYFERKDSDFVPWVQMLAEVIKEVHGTYLFVSFSLFPGEEPELELPRSFDAIKRVHPIIVELDTVRNIVEVFRRWGGITPRSVDLSSLKGAVNDNEFTSFERRLRDTYPFNPVFLDVVLRLGEESIARRTHVQLTRELLRTLAKSFINARKGELVTFAHLPEPRDLIIIGGEFAAYWDALVRLYEEDVKRVEERKLGVAALSVLRHIFLATFLARLIPSTILYPSEDDLILGSFNGLDVRPLDVKAALQGINELSLHVVRLNNNKYIYWYIRDEADAIRDAILKFSTVDSMQVATDEVASIIRERAGAFSAIYVSGVGGPKSFGKVHIISNRDEWQKALENSDDSILAIDLHDFKISKRRNNLIVVRRNDNIETPQNIKEFLAKFGNVKYIKDAIDYLGRIIKAIDEINGNLSHYFPDLDDIKDERFKREVEALLKSRLTQWKEYATVLLRQSVNLWLSNVVYGFKDIDIKDRGVSRLDDFLTEVIRSKSDKMESIVKKIFEGDLVNWDGFKKIDDLWSLYLNNESFPPAPISFDEFKDKIRDYCSGCQCIFEISGKVVWLSKDKCEVPQLDKDVGVVPFIWHGSPVEWAVEAFLKQLAGQSSGLKRYYIVYRRPSGEEVRRSVFDVLSSRKDWLYLIGGRVEEEVVNKSIDIKVDGVSTYIVERNPGSKVSIEVSASDVLKSVIYRIGDAKNEVMVNGTNCSFELELPKEPGDYKLEIEAVFNDGSRDNRSIVVKVKGKCIRTITTYSISTNDRLRGIVATSIDAADKLLQYLQRLVSHGYDFNFKLNVNQGGVGDVTINLSAEFKISSPDRVNSALRLLRALRDISPSIDATVEFRRAIPVNSDMIEYFKGYSFQYIIDRETEC